MIQRKPNERNRKTLRRNAEGVLDSHNTQRDGRCADYMRCGMYGHACCAVGLINRLGMSMAVGQRNRRNRQKSKGRKEDQNLASGSISDITHT